MNREVDDLSLMRPVYERLLTRFAADDINYLKDLKIIARLHRMEERRCATLRAAQNPEVLEAFRRINHL